MIKESDFISIPQWKQLKSQPLPGKVKDVFAFWNSCTYTKKELRQINNCATSTAFHLE